VSFNRTLYPTRYVMAHLAYPAAPHGRSRCHRRGRRVASPIPPPRRPPSAALHNCTSPHNCTSTRVGLGEVDGEQQRCPMGPSSSERPSSKAPTGNGDSRPRPAIPAIRPSLTPSFRFCCSGMNIGRIWSALRSTSIKAKIENFVTKIQNFTNTKK
jgi:hypothetical protein